MGKHGAFVLRLALGSMFIAHAGLKYWVFTLPVLLVATWAHSGNGWVFTSPNGANALRARKLRQTEVYA